jgi:hypothetical protein
LSYENDERFAKLAFGPWGVVYVPLGVFDAAVASDWSECGPDWRGEKTSDAGKGNRLDRWRLCAP